MLDALLVKENIVHLGAVLYLFGFLFRDQLLLRAFVIAGDVIYIAYFFLAPATPLWGGIFWGVAFIAVNTWMIARIVADRSHFGMGEDERRLFVLLESLSPGELRRLAKAGVWLSPVAETVLTVEGKPLDRLYYVLDGEVTIDKLGRRVTLPAPMFIGEVAFLTARPASATVRVPAGSRYVEWETARLSRLLLRAPSIRVALSSALNRDMAAKVARP